MEMVQMEVMKVIDMQRGKIKRMKNIPYYDDGSRTLFLNKQVVACFPV